ncbi:hypothetical protein [Paenibacillus tianjinensis]|uniref:IDEAL domain-containing protein n=1 Tax=Paenibacillus tianjinensis TaxID=2810347 RepID=A0ABX7L8F3_9BACL|nr:hypothetical protein [Paenibacillus tianjinensis]QSF43294.1 hypothetical protein JRJ22_18680 [Paenibacillus tianjinensis]
MSSLENIYLNDYDHLTKKQKKRWKAKDYVTMRSMIDKYFSEYNIVTMLYISLLEKAKDNKPELQVVIDCLDQKNHENYSKEQDYFESLMADVAESLIPYKG